MLNNHRKRKRHFKLLQLLVVKKSRFETNTSLTEEINFITPLLTEGP